MRDLVLSGHPAPPVVEVVHHGIAAPFLREDPTGAPRRGIVCVADAYPHKRLDLVVEAWRHLGPDRPPLRLIGQDMGGAPAAEAGLEISDRLDTGGVARVVREAQVAVLASTNESFGLPAVEALACGTPLVASDIPAYREVTGGHATLVASNRADDWTEAITAAIAGGPADAAAQAWARGFTWQRAAAQTAAVLEQAASRLRTR
jgi:glycosyltransferase involved in cell wall biosynthesis